nr:hypothetical protein CFP56_32235 [Quercus suber]
MSRGLVRVHRGPHMHRTLACSAAPCRISMAECGPITDRRGVWINQTDSGKAGRAGTVKCYIFPRRSSDPSWDRRTAATAGFVIRPQTCNSMPAGMHIATTFKFPGAKGWLGSPGPARQPAPSVDLNIAGLCSFGALTTSRSLVV